ncbi:MAG TPA: DUF1810 domain-containing protein, partial [Phnomibacter sp.]|nr:DUF1810 domain-containing protein [Phnomibacter sp.]
AKPSLERYVEAQEECWHEVRDELVQGKKRGHWMWFIFPQLKGHGYSTLSEYYGINNVEEARAYLDHVVLGPRLTDACSMLLQHEGLSAHAIFGITDAMKLRSCMALFHQATLKENSVFSEVTGKFFGGKPDPVTLQMLQG